MTTKYIDLSTEQSIKDTMNTDHGKGVIWTSNKEDILPIKMYKCDEKKK